MSAALMDSEAPQLARDVAPMYEGYVRVIDYAVRARGGMTAKLGLMGEEQVHPFKGYRTGGQGSGQRLKLAVSVTDSQGVEHSIYSSDALLSWWAEDCKVGMSVTVRFDDGPDGVRSHPLEGRQPGETLYMACWAVADDEQIQDPRAIRRSTRPFSQMGPAQQSQIKCRLDPEFRDWCRDFVVPRLPSELKEGIPVFRDDPKEYAAAVVRVVCGISSRAQFSEDTALGLAARNRWATMLRRYEDYQRR